MNIQEMAPVGAKTTMRIGGNAKYYAEITAREEAEEAVKFAQEKNIPLIPLGGGSNTIFADGVIDALVVRMKNAGKSIDGNTVRAEAGYMLPSLIFDLAKENLDLSPLTGILGTVGGAVFGNAGQGPKGIWIDSYIQDVTLFTDGTWQTLKKEECDYRYRESKFKDLGKPLIIWETRLIVPSKPYEEVKAEVERLLKKRIETQPHIKTAGSCFKALPDGTPAWQLIEKAGLRGLKIGGVQVAEKHANFLLNVDKGTFKDALAVTKKIREQVPQIADVEMRFYGENGKIVN